MNPGPGDTLVGRLRDLRAGPGALAEVVAQGSAAVPALESLLRSRTESVSQSRCLAAQALGSIGTVAAREALRRAMRDSLDRVLDPVLMLAEGEVVAAVAEAMAVNPSEEDLEALERALRRRPNPGVVRALGAIHDVGAIPLLIPCLADATASGEAADVLLTFGSDAVGALTKAALLPAPHHGREGDTSVRVRALAIELLGRIASPATDLPLVWALTDPQHKIRLGAALALAWRGPPDGAVAVPTLVEALAEEEWLVADEAAAALATLGGEVIA